MDVSMASSGVGPTEDVVRALLNHLVDPLLPSFKSSARGFPSASQQQAVAKQVHALVLLYNYYYRKSHPELEFLCFESFVKLAVVLKPTLMAHMKLMHRSDVDEVEDLENQLSPTEKAIMDACVISSTLDPSKVKPDIAGWPVCKVAVMLVDSRRENCFLLYSSVTNGVWSVVEKDLCVSNTRSEATVEGKRISKRIRTNKKILKDQVVTDEAGLQQHAFSAVKEAAGIDQTDLVVLESHIVYSLSKVKTAARFYIMQCTKFIKEDLHAPIVEVIQSLQGPLVQMNLCRWMTTPVIKYFHMLPYAGILSDWLSREVLSNSSENLMAETENLVVKSSQRADSRCSKEVNTTDNYDVADSISNDANGTIEAQKQEDYNRCPVSSLSSFADGPVNMDVNHSSLVCSSSQDQSKLFKVHCQKNMAAYMENNRGTTTGGRDVEAEMVDSTMTLFVTEYRGEVCGNISSNKDGIVAGDRAVVPSHLGSLQATLTSKEDALSCTALKVLINKRENLSWKLQNLHDEIAVCDKSIQMASNGDVGDLTIKIDGIVDSCKDVCVESTYEGQERTYKHLEEQDSSVDMKEERLSEAFLSIQNPCQVLDDVCYKNNWKLPTYCVLSSNGGFLANVSLKGMDFELSLGTGVHSRPGEARESAAAKMISKLSTMVG